MALSLTSEGRGGSRERGRSNLTWTAGLDGRLMLLGLAVRGLRRTMSGFAVHGGLGASSGKANLGGLAKWRSPASRGISDFIPINKTRLSTMHQTC